MLLQVLDFGADQILVALDADDRNSIITHVADNLQHKLLQLFLLLSLVLLDKCSFFTQISLPLVCLLFILIVIPLPFVLPRRLLTLQTILTICFLQICETAFNVFGLIASLIPFHFCLESLIGTSRTTAAFASHVNCTLE